VSAKKLMHAFGLHCVKNYGYLVPTLTEN